VEKDPKRVREIGKARSSGMEGNRHRKKKWKEE